MKALTVQQPWAWAIFHGKDVENRTTMWRHRGLLAIHAGTRWSGRGGRSPLVWTALAELGWVTSPAAAARDPRPGFDTIRPAGIVLGTVQLVDVHRASDGCCSSAWAEDEYRSADGTMRHDVVHLVLEDPVALAEPIPYVGSLGLWDLPDEVLVA